ncbi:MAG: sulfur carrier protein ThiS [Nitrosomonas sp.]|nr:sulfur carrier protein ThiS [Nitrosomonas sp.]MCC7136514.1 sulfur carrier protein ThiS [Nitrosomonas sp.]
MQIVINGQSRCFDNVDNVQQLLESLSLQNKRIAVECNGEIIPRSTFSSRILTDGDQLEIIVAVGGG